MCLSRSASERSLVQNEQSSSSSLAASPAHAKAAAAASAVEAQLRQRAHAAAPEAARQAARQSPLRRARDESSDDGWPSATFDTSRWRWREFALIYGAYMTLLLARKNYGFWLPSVLSELGAGKGEAGMLGSTFEIAYGSCALLNGILIDLVPPKALLVGALLTSAGVNVALGSAGSLGMMALLWGSNGVAQSFGWPSITNVFLAWFPDPASRGSWYSLLSTCQNAGAALVPLVVSATVARFGWRAAVYTPAAAAAAAAFVLAALLFGSPAAVAAVHGKGDMQVARDAPQRKLGGSGLASMLGKHVLLNGELWLMVREIQSKTRL